MSDTSTPILVGCGDVTDTTTPAEAGRSPFDLIAEASQLALSDAGAVALARVIDVVAAVRLFADTSPRFVSKLGGSTNPPKSIAQRLGIPAARYVYSSGGGNMPQYLVNHFSEAIAEGEVRAVLIAGGEALRTHQGVERAHLPISWNEDPGGEPESVGITRPPRSAEEERHNLRAPGCHLSAYRKRDSRGARPEHFRAPAGDGEALLAVCQRCCGQSPCDAPRRLLGGAFGYRR